MNIITKKFIFVRHDSCDSNIENYGLNTNGKEQALAAAVNIEKYLHKTSNKITEIISSELNRAKETAQIISEYSGNIPVSYNNNLNLRYFNDSSEEEINFNKRVSNTIFDIIQNKHNNLIIVSHIDVFQSIQQVLINDVLLKINKGEQMIFSYDGSWDVKSLLKEIS